MVSLLNYKRSPIPQLPESRDRWLEEELRKLERVTEDNNQQLAGAVAYTLPAATITTLGGIKVGSNLTITTDGTLSATAYTLPKASASVLGGIKVGSNLSIAADGTLSATATPYTLPTASASTLGGVKVGSNLSIAGDGTLSATGSSYTLPTASATTLGGIKVGSNLSIDGSGVLSATGSTYTLPIASSSTLGGVKVGSGLSIDGTGVLSTTGGGGGTSYPLYNVMNYGADPTNTTDSYTAFVNAIAAIPSTGGALYVPAGTYKISSKLVITNKAIRVVGDGMNQTKLVFTTAATGGLEFNLTQSGGDGTASFYYNASVADLSVLTENTTNSYSFNAGGSGTSASMSGKKAISYIPSSQQAGSPYPTVQVDRVYIGGKNGFSEYWDIGVYLPNAVNVLITDSYINGHFNTTDMSIGVAVLNQAVTVQLSNTFMSYGGTGVFVYSPGFSGVGNNGVEGIQVVGCGIVGFMTGVYRYYGALTDSARPLTLVTGSHLNCISNCLGLSDTTETVITGNLFYVQTIWGGSPSVSPGAAAIGLGYSNFSTTTNRHTITGNIFRNLSGVTAVRGIVSNVRYAAISGNTFTDFDIGIILQSNAKYHMITGCVFENTPTQIQNGGDSTNGYSSKTAITGGTSVNPF